MEVLFFVAKLGFEPRQTEPESVVLPLHHLAKPITDNRYPIIDNRILPNGVTVALQILVLSVWVRILVWQQEIRLPLGGLIFLLYSRIQAH